MSKSVLGIDMGSYAVKMIELKRMKGNKASLVGLGIGQLPIEMVPNWEDDFDPGRPVVSQLMSALVSRLKFTSKHVSTSVSGDSIVAKNIFLPHMSPSALANCIYEESEQHIPFSLKDVNLSYSILDNSTNVNGQMAVLLVAAKKNMVANYMESITKAKLKPAVVDIDGLALCNAYEFVNPNHRDNVILVDIGANLINIIVLQSGTPLILKDESGGGQYLTYELSNLLQCEYEEAEATKFSANPSPMAATVVDSMCANWIASVERAIDMARVEEPLYKPTRILLSGGGSLLVGLANEFQNYFSIDTELFNPLLSVQFNQKKYDYNYIQYIGPQMAVSFGLALRKVEIE